MSVGLVDADGEGGWWSLNTPCYVNSHRASRGGPLSPGQVGEHSYAHRTVVSRACRAPWDREASPRAGTAKAALTLWLREGQRIIFLGENLFIKAGLSLLAKNKQVISSSSLSQHFLANHHWTGRPEGHE